MDEAALGERGEDVSSAAIKKYLKFQRILPIGSFENIFIDSS